jgi:hypothetical protein
MANHVITANNLRNGFVVYRAADNKWVSSINRAAVNHSRFGTRLDQTRMTDADQTVVDVYRVEVEIEGDIVRPVCNRECIRAYGPTTVRNLTDEGSN